MWIVKDVVHSGRKGTRYTQVNEFLDLVGCYVDFDIKDIKHFKPIQMIIHNSEKKWDWLNTSQIIQVGRRFDGLYELETVNAIYVLEEINNDNN